MTIDEAIHTADQLTPNAVPRRWKLDWLTRLDERIFQDLMSRHEDPDAPETFSGYTEDTDPDTQLLARAPHDEVYRYYLEMQMHLAQQELDLYNNSAMLYANAWQTFAREYHREHKPKTGKNYHHF